MLGLLYGGYLINTCRSIAIIFCFNFLRRLISNLGDATTITKLPAEEKEKKKE
ncbi:hypothetical protein [Bacillus mycoides]|uniref:hypothetical protein n=1 Tax=Bacillus mycoides TaxID=1405 RepID=UPI000AB5B167|nr:hypothetical protein [Bacillus mycoides]